MILLYQPSQTHTIPRKSPTPLPPLSKVRCCRRKNSGDYRRDCHTNLCPAPNPPKTAPSLENHQHPCHMNALLFRILAKLWAFNFGHPCPSLVKGEVLSPKKFGRLPEELPHQPSPRTNPSKNRTIPLAFRRGASLLLPLHRILPFPQQLQKDNNPSKIANTLASLVTKGGGLTARHKLLLCCVLIATHPPFLSPNLSAVKTEGLSH